MEKIVDIYTQTNQSYQSDAIKVGSYGS